MEIKLDPLAPNKEAGSETREFAPQKANKAPAGNTEKKNPSESAAQEAASAPPAAEKPAEAIAEKEQKSPAAQKEPAKKSDPAPQKEEDDDAEPKHPPKKKHRAAILIPVIILALLAGAFLVATHNWSEEIVTYETTNTYITPYGQTMVSAHRSGGGIFPENTLMAFEGCLSSKDFKTDIFEFDLHITKDGELILLHDDTLDRTTNSEAVFGVTGARPENYTLAQLKQLNFGEGFVDDNGNTPYKGLSGSAVPASLHAVTLNEVLDLLEGHGGYRYIIEIKNKKELGFAAADALYTILSTKKLLPKVIVGTFNGEITRYIDDCYPDMLRSASITEVLEFYISSLLNMHTAPGYYKYTALQIPANQFLIKLGTSKLTNYAHKNNIAVQYWTINEADDIAMLKEINADCVMSDVPDVAYGILNGK